MKKRFLALLAIPLLALTACDGYEEVDYQTFNADFIAATSKRNEVTFEAAVFNGYVVDGEVEYAVEDYQVPFVDGSVSLLPDAGSDIEQTFYRSALLLMVSLQSLLNQHAHNGTFYSGDGFKFISDKNEIKCNEYAMLTKAKLAYFDYYSHNFSVNWVIAK